MGNLWSISLLILGLAAVYAGMTLATGNEVWPGDTVEPNRAPTGPGSEGMGVMTHPEIAISGADESDEYGTTDEFTDSI